MHKTSAAVTVLAAAAAVALLAQQQFVDKLPPPFSTPSANNGPKVVDRPEGAQLHVPAGFQVEEYATGFDTPRFMLLGPSGEILLSDFTPQGSVYALVDNGAHKNPERKKILDGLNLPYGLALWKGYLYVGEMTSVKSYKYDSKAMTADKGAEGMSVKEATARQKTPSLRFRSKGDIL